MRRNRKKRDTQHRKKKKSEGGYREGELPVAIATTGALVQSPRQCLVARERFRWREKGARQAAALFPDDSPGSGKDDRDYFPACLFQASPSGGIFTHWHPVVFKCVYTCIYTWICTVQGPISSSLVYPCVSVIPFTPIFPCLISALSALSGLKAEGLSSGTGLLVWWDCTGQPSVSINIRSQMLGEPCAWFLSVLAFSCLSLSRSFFLPLLLPFSTNTSVFYHCFFFVYTNMALEMAMLVSPDWNISTTLGCIPMKCFYRHSWSPNEFCWLWW